MLKLASFILALSIVACSGVATQQPEPVDSTQQGICSLAFNLCVNDLQANIHLIPDPNTSGLGGKAELCTPSTPGGTAVTCLASQWCADLTAQGFVGSANQSPYNGGIDCPIPGETTPAVLQIWRPTYPLNRVYDPARTVLGASCMTTGGLLGNMVDKCSTIPTTCGFLYCVANP